MCDMFFKDFESTNCAPNLILQYSYIYSRTTKLDGPHS